MRMGFIARGLTKGGVTRYIENVLSILDKNFSKQVQITLFTDRSDYQARYTNLDVVYIKPCNKLVWDYFKILHYFKIKKLDVVYYPKNIIPFTHVFFRFKKINIVHDLAYFDVSLNEYDFFDTCYMRTFLKLSCGLAYRTIAVSNATKADLIKILHIPKEKISVIYEAVEERFYPIIDTKKTEVVLKKYQMNHPYIFFCGSLSPRKNILRALMAFNRIKNDVPHHVYLAGGQSWHDTEVKKYIASTLADRVHIVGYVEEADLPVLYSAASLYLYPSLYEGFGLPILEAQACGCPVLTSDRTSCPEIAGDGAIITNPLSIEEIFSCMKKVLLDDEFAKKLINMGMLNVKKYSWFKTVVAMLGQSH